MMWNMISNKRNRERKGWPSLFASVPVRNDIILYQPIFGHDYLIINNINKSFQKNNINKLILSVKLLCSVIVYNPYTMDSFTIHYGQGACVGKISCSVCVDNVFYELE